MANSSRYSTITALQGPGGRGVFLDAFSDTFPDGCDADIVFTTLVETRLNLTDWVHDYSLQHRGAPIDCVMFQNARREGRSHTRSRVRGWVEGCAAKYNGNLKSLVAFTSKRFREDADGLLFGRLTEARLAGVPVPNPKKAFMGKSVVERDEGPNQGVRFCFAGAHFPVCKLAAALEDSAIDQLHGAKVALARSLRKVLRKASRGGVADKRTVLFVQGDLNSRTVLRNEDAHNEYTVMLDRAKGGRLGVELNDSGPVCYSVYGHLLVAAICRGGDVEAWNLENPAEQVRIGDCIVEVNGIRDDIPRMVEALKTDGMLEMRCHRKVTDVLLEVLRDDEMQAAIQHDLSLPPGRWHEVAEYDTVYDLPVTYKFLDNVGYNAAEGSLERPTLAALTIGDIMTCDDAKANAQSHDDLDQLPESPTKRHDAWSAFSMSSQQSAPVITSSQASISSNSSVEVYRRQMTKLGDNKLQAYGLAYKKHDFRAFRFPASADRVVFWAPDAIADRISLELPRGGYEVNHAQLGSDHRPVALEVVVRIAPEGQRIRRSRLLSAADDAFSARLSMVLEQSDPEGHSDEEHSTPEDVGDVGSASPPARRDGGSPPSFGQAPAASSSACFARATAREAAAALDGGAAANARHPRTNDKPGRS